MPIIGAGIDSTTCLFGYFRFDEHLAGSERARDSIWLTPMSSGFRASLTLSIQMPADDSCRTRYQPPEFFSCFPYFETWDDARIGGKKNLRAADKISAARSRGFDRLQFHHHFQHLIARRSNLAHGRLGAVCEQ